LTTPFRLELPRRIYDEIVAQAQAELPNECCGMLAGRVEPGASGPVGHVLRRFPLANAAASPREFLSDARAMFAAEKARRAENLDFLAVYHSHPASPPVPSKTDLERNYSPDVMNLIVSLRGDTPELKGWWLAEKGISEADVCWEEE
jgi:proteasome lid subunit RPN8/RPN11